MGRTAWPVLPLLGIPVRTEEFAERGQFLRSGGDKYTGYSYYEVFDPNGKPVIDPTTGLPVAGFGTNTGTRLTVDLKVPPFPSSTSKP